MCPVCRMLQHPANRTHNGYFFLISRFCKCLCVEHCITLIVLLSINSQELLEVVATEFIAGFAAARRFRTPISVRILNRPHVPCLKLSPPPDPYDLCRSLRTFH